MVYDPKELIIRMQDNCPAFNVERQIAIAISEGQAEPDEQLLRNPQCPFVLYVGNKKLVKRKKFEEFLEQCDFLE